MSLECPGCKKKLKTSEAIQATFTAAVSLRNTSSKRSLRSENLGTWVHLKIFGVMMLLTWKWMLLELNPMESRPMF